MTTTTGTWYPPALGTGGFLHEGQLFTNPPFHPMTSAFKKGDQVVMHNRLRDDIVTVTDIADGLVSVTGTFARFCEVTGKQMTRPNCWDGWRIEPAKGAA